MNSVVQNLLEIFGINDYHAKASRYENGDIYYSPVEARLTDIDISDHLNGKIALGSYQLSSGSDTVTWFGWDVDSKDHEKAREIVKIIEKRLSSVPHCVEFSGGKGYHVLVFLKNPISASVAKKIVDYVSEQEGFAKTGEIHVECFPKQDKLTKSRPKGNLLKIPLGEHPRTHEHSRFVDPLNGWESGPSIDPLAVLTSKASEEDILSITDEEVLPETLLVQLISQYWEDGKRHDLSLFLSGYLAHESWGMEQAKDLMRKIVAATGDSEEYNRLQTVETTFQKHKEGKSIRGRQGLGEILPVAVMQRLTELVSKLRAPDTVTQIDDIRYDKARPPLENARLASSTIWSILNDEDNKIFQTENAQSFWYSSENHTVTDLASDMWFSILNKLFGLNQQDKFSRLVYDELNMRVIREAPFVPIQNRTYWQENPPRLYINTGGPEVFILDGTDIKKTYNGECGYFFITNESGKYTIPDFEAPIADVWDNLVNDISFTTSVDAPSKPDEQREMLKAWLLAFFFQEILPTKPILALLGAAGSGKTTTIRRVLKIFENPDSDVLGVPTDKQDAFRASIAGHRLLVLDNLEKSGSFWMVDMLNKLATGGNIELRQLYQTNKRYIIIPRCFVACTAVNMPFSDETLFSRLLVLETQSLSDPVAEHVLQKRIRELGPAIWADLLKKLNKVVKALITRKDVRNPSKSRLVDFTTFCERIKLSGVVDGDKLSLGLLSLVDAQMRQLKESSQAVNMIEEWISSRPAEAGEWHTYQEIFTFLTNMAISRRSELKWKNAVGLARHLETLKKRLEFDFGAEFKDDKTPDLSRNVTKIRFRTQI